MAEITTIPSFYEYLKEKDVSLDKLSDQELDALRMEFSKYRNRLYKQRQRAQKREVTVYLDRAEHKLLKSAAQNHHLVLSHFIKQASLKYVDGTYITPDTATLKLVLSEVAEIGTRLEKLTSKKRSLFSISQDAEELKSMLRPFQNGLIAKVTSPINVEQWITVEVSKNPSFKRKLITLLLSHV